MGVFQPDPLWSSALSTAESALAAVTPELRLRGSGVLHDGLLLTLNVAASRSFTVTFRGPPTIRVSGELSGDQWKTECSCPLRQGCKHGVAALLAFCGHARRMVAIEIRSGVSNKTPDAKAAPPARDPLHDKIRRLAGYENQLTPQQREWIDQLAEVSVTALRDGKIAAWEVAKLVGGRRLGISITPLPVKDIQDGWELVEFLATVLTDGDFRLLLPAWVQDLLQRAEVEPKIQLLRNAGRAEQLRALSAKFLNHRTRLGGLRRLELRVALIDKEARYLHRLHPTHEWREVSATELDGKFNRASFSSGRALLPQITPPALAVLRMIEQEYRGSGEIARLSTLEQQRWRFSTIIQSGFGGEILCDRRGNLLPWDSNQRRWVVEDHGDSYRLVAVDRSGGACLDTGMINSSEPYFQLCADKVLNAPNEIPPFISDLRPSLLPRIWVESDAGLTVLFELGAELPDALNARRRVVTLEPSIAGETRIDGKGGRSAHLQLQALADGVVVSTFTPAEGWKDQEPREGGAAEKEHFTVYDRQLLVVAEDLLGAFEGKDRSNTGMFRITKQFPEQLREWSATLPTSVSLRLDPELEQLRGQEVEASGSVALAESGSRDWFDLSLSIFPSDGKFSEEELRLLVGAAGRFVELKRHGWTRLRLQLSKSDSEVLESLGTTAQQLALEPQRLHRLHLEEAATKEALPEVLRRMISERPESLQVDIASSIHSPLPLREYQQQGINFLSFLARENLGGILADDMGLGKTAQTILWLSWLIEQSKSSESRCSLIVAPKSVVPNWIAEVTKFAPHLRIRIVDGHTVEELPQLHRSHDLLVTTYALLRLHNVQFVGQPWLAAVLDEAQFIKNPVAGVTEVTKQLIAKHRLVLTGTPIENRLLDLWSIMDFCNPGLLGSERSFRQLVGKETPSKAILRWLSKQVRPFLLRRTKSQVLPELPPKTETDRICEMEGVQRTLYQAEAKRIRQMLLKITSPAELQEVRFNVLAGLTRLRQIACHPKLVDPKLQNATSAKVESLFELLEELRAENAKVVVFSQFTTMLSILTEAANARGWENVVLTGQTQDRAGIIDQFKHSPNACIFFISLRAGGFGINLTEASYVVLFDPWWNPAVESQAIDRCHRIGQSSPVIAYRLLSADTIETKMRSLQAQKRALATDVIDEQNFGNALTLEDLQALVSAS